MPYAIKKVGSKFKVINKNTGKVHGTHSTKAKALSQMRLLYGIEKGWKPTFSKRAMASKLGSKK
jgi:hypothetical protein